MEPLGSGSSEAGVSRGRSERRPLPPSPSGPGAVPQATPDAESLQSESAVVDAGLVVRTLSGEKEAFSELVKKHQKRALSVAYSYLSNEDDAKEVTQDAFLKVYRNLASLQKPEAFLSFLLRTTGNLALNFRRGRRLRRNPGLDDAVLDGDENPDPGSFISDHTRQSVRPGRSLEDKELGERRRKAMASLPEKQRLAIELFAVQELPQKEVAEALGCSVEAVKWYVFQGRKKLKELLKDVL